MYRHSEEDEEEEEEDDESHGMRNTNSEFTENNETPSLERSKLQSPISRATMRLSNTNLVVSNHNNNSYRDNNISSQEEEGSQHGSVNSAAPSILSATINYSEFSRRLSLQVNSSGNPVRQGHGSESEGNSLALNPQWRVVTTESSQNVPKLPGGSRYFVTQNDEPSHHPSSATSRIQHIDPIASRPFSSYPWHEEHLSTISSPRMDNSNRPSSTIRTRPINTAVSRPRGTGIQRVKSPKYIWPQSLLNSALVPHLPPGGPDCMPGCGYSGLPCYICSIKIAEEHSTKTELSRSMSFFTILQRREPPVAVHRSRGDRDAAVNEEDSDNSARSLKPCLNWLNARLKSACKSLRLPQSRLKQVVLTCFIIYILLIIHIGITRLIRDFHL